MKLHNIHWKKLSKLFFAVLLIVLVLHFVFRIFQYRAEFFSKYDPAYWQYRYGNSQWVIPVDCHSLVHKPNTDGYKWCVKNHAMNKKQIVIGDDGLYAYEGWKYIQGMDPTILNAEVHH